jgi:hypothetical protein
MENSSTIYKAWRAHGLGPGQKPAWLTRRAGRHWGNDLSLARQQTPRTRKAQDVLRAADRQMSLVVEALLNLSPYLRDGQIHIDIRKCDRQIALPIPYDSAGPA